MKEFFDFKASDLAGYFDLEHAEQLFELKDKNKKPLMYQMLNLFLQESKKSMGQLSHAIEKNETASVKNLAHKLKGMGIDIGVKDFSELCEEIERDGSSQTLDQLKILVTSHGELCNAIERFLK